MKYMKAVTLHLGNYESLKVGVDDAPSFEECDKAIKEEVLRILGDENFDESDISRKIKQALNWEE